MTTRAAELVKSIAAFVGDKTYAVRVQNYVRAGSVIMMLNPVRIHSTDPEVLLICSEDYKPVVVAAAQLAQSKLLYAASGDTGQIESFP